VFLLFYYRRMDILRKNKGCRDFLDSLKIPVKRYLFFAPLVLLDFVQTLIIGQMNRDIEHTKISSS
ncbi:hypothetical protein P8807_20990, partial [Bacillus subtilis]|uniref:hypothetical protein n=1 Tax=Bacillus subtilis TaxID=1423 RepID=UPI002DBC6430